MPLNAGRLVVSEIARTARQEHQRRDSDRSFDDREHARDPLLKANRAQRFRTRQAGRLRKSPNRCAGVTHAKPHWQRSLRAGGASEGLGQFGGPIGDKPPAFIRLSYRPVTLLS
jgi:hypothetical protein